MRPWICLALFAACGDDPHTTVDAPMHGTDTIPIDTPVNTVTCTPSGSTGQVTVDGPTSDDTALAVTFVVHDPSGAVVSRSAAMGTDATVMLDVPACGMVSVVKVDSFQTEVLTFTAVQKGDHLVHTGRTQPGVERDVAITVPAQTGATSYQVIAVCSGSHLEFTSTPNPGVVNMTPECTNGSVSIVATAMPGKQVSISTVALAATGTTSLTLPAFAAPAQSTLTGHTLGTYATGVYATFAKPSGNLLLLGTSSTVNISNGAASFAAPIASGEGGYELVLDGTGTPKQHALIARGTASIPTTVDISGTDLLPPVTASIDADTRRPTITWATTAQAAVALFEVHAGDASWNVVAPPVSADIKLPDLPTDLWPGGAPKLTGAGVLDSTAVTTYNANNFALVLQNFPAVGAQVRQTFLDTPATAAFARRRW